MPNEQGSLEKKIKKPVSLRARNFFNAFTDKLGDRHNGKTVRVVLLLVTSVLLTLLIVPGQQFISAKFKAGDIASTDIKATQGYLLEDRLLTEKKRAVAVSSVPFVYNFYPNRAEELTGRFEQAFVLLSEDEQGNRTDNRENLQKSVADAL